MRVILEPVNDPGDRIEVSRFPFRIGRSPACELRISDRMVSRIHCELTVQDEAIFVRDLHSKNGTLLNGDVVTGREVKDGDVLTVGLNSFRLRNSKPLLRSLWFHRMPETPVLLSAGNGSSVIQNA